MALGNNFDTGGDIVDGQDSQPFWTRTYTDEQYPLGTLRLESADNVADAEHTDGTALGLKGDRTWIFVKATTALTIYDCAIVKAADTATASFEVAPSDAAGDNALDVVGVTQTAIAENSFGWIVCDGECVVNGNAGITAGQFLDTHTGGQVDDSTAAGTLIGKALSDTNTPVSGTIRARIRLP
tara:strand:+ start:5572 stop:6120 length:549 start_codon:yes stop_codon:yes gene_type:complete